MSGTRLRLVLPVLLALLCMAPAGLRAAPVDTLARELGPMLQRLQREDDFSGVVLLARGEHVLFERAYGLAHRGLGVPNRRDTRFNLASINKLFTSLAVLRLVDQGRLTLDEPFARWWPDYPQRAVAERVTVRQLLAHTSGLGNYWARHAEVAKDRLRTPADYLPLFAADAPAFEPGSRFGYSNGGYIVLGLLIERLTGETYHEHVRHTIFAPLGMHDTDSWPLDEVVPRMSVGHMRSPERPGLWLNNLHHSEFRGSPAGGGFSTARDLLRFARAMARGDMLEPATMKLWTAGVSDFSHGRYALGVIEQRHGSHRIIGHSGGHVGVACEMMLFEDLDVTAVILSNGDVDGYRAVRNAIVRRLIGSDRTAAIHFRTRQVIQSAQSHGGPAAQSLAHALRAEGTLSESAIDLAAGKWLHRGRVRHAIALAELNVSLFPQSGDALLRLARVQLAFGRKTAARQSFERNLQIEPDDAEVRALLERLQTMAR